MANESFQEREREREREREITCQSYSQTTCFELCSSHIRKRLNRLR